jgi:hypothetical protein
VSFFISFEIFSNIPYLSDIKVIGIDSSVCFELWLWKPKRKFPSMLGFPSDSFHAGISVGKRFFHSSIIGENTIDKDRIDQSTNLVANTI